MWKWITSTIAAKTKQAELNARSLELAVKQLEAASNLYALADPDEDKLS